MSTNLKQTFDLAATALVAVAAGLFIWTQVESRWLRPPVPRVQDNRIVDAQGLIASSDLRYPKGTGPVALVEFTDYDCPFCGRFTQQTAPVIEKELVEAGVIRHVVFNFPLEQIHPAARRAAEAAVCAGRQGRYWEMHTRLFNERNSLDAEKLAETLKAVGLDQDPFTQCLAGQASAQVTNDIAQGKRLGVTSTPTFFVGTVQPDGSIRLVKRLNGAAPYDELKRIIEDVRRAATSSS